jgi:hypothetical protein
VSYYDNLEFLKDIVPEKVATQEAIERRRKLFGDEATGDGVEPAEVDAPSGQEAASSATDDENSAESDDETHV